MRRPDRVDDFVDASWTHFQKPRPRRGKPCVRQPLGLSLRGSPDGLVDARLLEVAPEIAERTAVNSFENAGRGIRHTARGGVGQRREFLVAVPLGKVREYTA